MRPRLAPRKPPRPRPLQLEVLEDRRLLSAGHPFLSAPDHHPPADPPAAAVRPADYHAHDSDHAARDGARDDHGDGHAHDDHAYGDGDDPDGGDSAHGAHHPPAGQGGGTDTGHGSGDGHTPPPPSSPGTPGHVPNVGTSTGPTTATGDQTQAGGDATRPPTNENNATAAPTQVTARPGPTTTHDDNGKTAAAPSADDPTAADQAAALPPAPVVAVAPVGAPIEGNTAGGLSGSTGTGLAALPGVTGVHAGGGAFATYAVGGVLLPLLTGPGNYSVEVGTPEVAENAAGGTTTARPVPVPSSADPGGSEADAVATDPVPVEAGLLTNVLSPNLSELGNEAGGLLQGVEDLLARIGTSRSAWALGPALAAAVGAAAYVGVRRRRQRRQQAASLGLPAADADSDSWLPGSDSIKPREGA